MSDYSKMNFSGDDGYKIPDEDRNELDDIIDGISDDTALNFSGYNVIVTDRRYYKPDGVDNGTFVIYDPVFIPAPLSSANIVNMMTPKGFVADGGSVIWGCSYNKIFDIIPRETEKKLGLCLLRDSSHTAYLSFDGGVFEYYDRSVGHSVLGNKVSAHGNAEVNYFESAEDIRNAKGLIYARAMTYPKNRKDHLEVYYFNGEWRDVNINTALSTVGVEGVFTISPESWREIMREDIGLLKVMDMRR